ncbi:hypothetical protein [Dactylosporangium sp. CA-092794]|uniref:hypothetical protein n=1 Tax=Dactylosporangium sp. CA-092794 TaxID=3239929 RepID=UPI003D8FAA41
MSWPTGDRVGDGRGWRRARSATSENPDRSSVVIGPATSGLPRWLGKERMVVVETGGGLVPAFAG